MALGTEATESMISKAKGGKQVRVGNFLEFPAPRLADLVYRWLPILSDSQKENVGCPSGQSKKEDQISGMRE